MRNKRFFAITACVLAAAFLLGFTGMVTLADVSAALAGEDRLVGILVTKEYLDLFDFEAYFNDHAPQMINGGGAIADSDANKYQNRLYATLVREERTDTSGETHTLTQYKFEEADGIAYFSAAFDEGDLGRYYSTSGDEALSDGHMSIAERDEGREVTLEGTVYTVIEGDTAPTLYFNPVYQGADGGVYATTGSGFSSSGDVSEGEAYAQTMSAQYKQTKNGATTTDSISVTISVNRVYKPVSVRVVQMNENNAVLSAEEYEPGRLPEKIVVAPGTAYIVVETRRRAPAGENPVSRAFVARGAETLEALCDRGDGICVKQYAALDWGK